MHGKTEEEILEAEDNFREYIKLVKSVCDRVEQEKEARTYTPSKPREPMTVRRKVIPENRITKEYVGNTMIFSLQEEFEENPIDIITP